MIVNAFVELRMNKSEIKRLFVPIIWELYSIKTNIDLEISCISGVVVSSEIRAWYFVK